MTRKRTHLSKAIQRDLERIDGTRIVVAAVITITKDEAAKYELAGLSLNSGKLAVAVPAPPPHACGIWARRNLDGWQEKRKDLPKEMRDVSSWAPNWKGSGHHLVRRSVEAWQVDHRPARMLTLSAAILEPLKDGAIVRFRIDQPLDRTDAVFAENLQFNLRLLREVVGRSQVFCADMSDEEFANLQSVDWELIPPGSADRVIARLAESKATTAEQLEVASERLRVLERLSHDGFIVGHGKFIRYFGARFGEKLLVLENLEYGNAMYLFEENWEELTKLSRTELIKRRDPKVHRLPHLPGWQSAIRELLRASR
ncbi:hypothetical protein QWY75_00345 [Pontixanthobacter aestiaquae]|uniref:Uncharacterized protein n=1 Tax=Pontixanthobacter aestiaquae TaxID=1509367 RepID=A0A844ZA02_9SPHN|nr:hypothetical protein [Pontixanthobacter aestiaquae]MDN3644647.1 hypothetical protein [Pontixanthobacter aestiaquae]MXO84344.1 hypothetical protein [Pontixanthobacter aestiaquae]